MYITKEKFEEICKHHSSLLVVEGDVAEALAFVQELLEAEADATKLHEPTATVSIDQLNMAAYKVFDIAGDIDIDLFLEEEKLGLDEKIQSAEIKGKVSDNPEREICLVNFRRVYGVGLGEFDVRLDIVPEEYRQGKKDFSLNADERILAYDKALEKIGDEDLSAFVLFSAEMVRAPKERSMDCFGER